MVPWSKAFMSYRGRACADRILKSFHDVQPSSSTSSTYVQLFKNPFPFMMADSLTYHLCYECSEVFVAVGCPAPERGNDDWWKQSFPLVVLYCTWNQLLFSPKPFIFVLSSHYFIFCITSNNLILLVIILSPYIVVILCYVTLSHYHLSSPHIPCIHYSSNVHDHLVPLCFCFISFSIFQ